MALVTHILNDCVFDVPLSHHMSRDLDYLLWDNLYLSYIYIYIYIRKLTRFLQKNCLPSSVIGQAEKDGLDRFHSSKIQNPFWATNPSASKLN